MYTPCFEKGPLILFSYVFLNCALVLAISGALLLNEMCTDQNSTKLYHYTRRCAYLTACKVR